MPTRTSGTRPLSLVDDDEVLETCARREPEERLRRRAMSRIADPRRLVALTLDRDLEYDDRKYAWKLVEDPDVLVEVAIDDPWNDQWHATEAVERLSDEARLTRVADESRDASARVAATRRIELPATLARLALEHEDSRVRLAAVARIEDQDVLDRVAASEPEESVREQAARKMTHPQPLADLALGDKDEDVRLIAIRRVHDADVLARIAREDPDGRNREPHLSLQAIGSSPAGPLLRELQELRSSRGELARLVLALREPLLSSAAGALEVEVLAEPIGSRYTTGWIPGDDVQVRVRRSGELVLQRHFKSVFPGSMSPTNHVPAKIDVQAAVTELLEALDPARDLLERLGSEALAWDLRLAALVRLDDQAAYARALATDPDGGLRRAVAPLCEDEELLARVACEDPDYGTVRAAVAALTDEGLLIRVATDGGYTARKDATIRLTDQEALGRIALSDESLSIQEDAVARIDDVPTLLRIVRGAKYDNVAYAAVLRLHDREVLESLEAEGETLGQVAELALVLDDPVLVELLGPVEARADAGRGESAFGDYRRLSLRLRLDGKLVSEDKWTVYTASLRFDACNLLSTLLAGRVSDADLGRLLSESTTTLLCRAAVSATTDPALRSSTARDHPDEAVRLTAIGLSKDLDLLREIAARRPATPESNAAGRRMREIDEDG